MPNLHCEAIAFPSSDGKHTSSAFLYTVPGQPVRAVLQLSHGMCEYVRRYAPMAEFYAAHGIALAGNDHLGHGDTAQAGEHGHYGEPNGRCHLLNDLHTMNRILHERFPDTPIILYGHSMGSFYARWYAEKWPESITALVISGTAGPSFTECRRPAAGRADCPRQGAALCLAADGQAELRQLLQENRERAVAQCLAFPR